MRIKTDYDGPIRSELTKRDWFGTLKRPQAPLRYTLDDEKKDAGRRRENGVGVLIQKKDYNLRKTNPNLKKDKLFRWGKLLENTVV